MKFKSASIILAVSMVMLMSPALELNTVYANSFTSEWAQPTVDAMSNAGMIPNSLRNDADFREDISREEFAELITTYFNKVKKQTSLPSSSDSKFTDTNNPLITLANQLGIVGGYPDGSFKPNATITRQEIAVMANQAERQLTNIMQSKDVKKFSDNRNIAPWAQEGVGSLSKAGGIGGYPDGTFKPTNKMSKQEAIALVGNLATKAGLIATGSVTPVPAVPPPVANPNVITGPAAEQALRNIIAERNYVNPNRPNTGPIGRLGVNSFQHVKNGESFVLEGQTVTGLSFEQSGDWVIITPKTNGTYKAGAFISVFGTDGINSVWQSIEVANGKFDTRLKQDQIKAVVLMTNDSNYVLIDIN